MSMRLTAIATSASRAHRGRASSFMPLLLSSANGTSGRGVGGEAGEFRGSVTDRRPVVGLPEDRTQHPRSEATF
jgi:hypothetical protein